MLVEFLGLNVPQIWILRLNHRTIRDKRVTTHLFLAARALGAKGAFYSGEKDVKIEESIRKINKSWGGDFSVIFTKEWQKTIQEWKRDNGEVIHLTMYGLPIQEVIDQIRSSVKKKLVIVGGAKVPRDAYELADWNISVTSQPHSEVSALSIFLHEFFNGSELKISFKNAEKNIIPQPKGKKITKTNI
ncbi:MAG: tRNA (cytidine(56)-2'-O)-methyltransferase [Candidatus Jordarchaeaceae archaeon]